MKMFKLMAIWLNNSIYPHKMVVTFILYVDLDLETQEHSHLIPHVEIAYKIYMVLNKCNHIYSKMTFTLAVNAEVDLVSQHKYRK